MMKIFVSGAMISVKRIKKKMLKEFEKEWKIFDEEIGIEWKEKDYCLGAFNKKQLVGYVKFNICGGVGYLHKLIVKKQERRKGIGKTLIEAFEEFCKDKCHKLTLKTSEKHKTAIKFYKKMGYKKETTLRNDKFGLKWFLMYKSVK
jgi:GNAT superfamily N-acetyltransferase